MNINGETKILARFHTKLSPRGLNIYNPYFQENGVNALYLLFHNPEPQPLINAMRSLNFAGAVAVGFETDPRLPPLLDELDEIARYVGRVGFIYNKEGRLCGSNQGGEGLMLSIENATSLAEKRIVIVGGGNVVKGLLYNINKKYQGCLPEIVLVNRTVEKIETLQNDFGMVKNALPLDAIHQLDGDLLINATPIGGSVEDTFYTPEIVNRFGHIADVTFEKEETNLIDLAKAAGKEVSTGWDMFTCQGLVVLEMVLGIKVDAKKLKECVIRGLSETVK
jgi:shikimate dehydrogenase